MQSREQPNATLFVPILRMLLHVVNVDSNQSSGGGIPSAEQGRIV